ncbi:MAG: nucleotide exchange factor GrpE [Limnobacter sp.]|nr:nucleotide exchange factor GrpE [Limnobacter sp.]
MIDEQGSGAGANPRNTQEDAAAVAASGQSRQSWTAQTPSQSGSGQAAGARDGAAQGTAAQDTAAPDAAGRSPAAQGAAGQAARDTGAGSSSSASDGGAAANRIAELEARCAELNDLYLRAVAETENVRRRGQEEVAKANKYGIESFAESLLPVRDSLELALSSDAPSVENIREGVETTLRLLATVFERNKLVEIDPAGQKFDPNLHQAISTVPGETADPPVAPNHVVTVLQKGYLINDRVLRPALVIVAQG